MTSVSMTSIPGTDFGRSASVAGSVCASFRHGIWMMSFFNGHETAELPFERQLPPVSASITPSHEMRLATS